MFSASFDGASFAGDSSNGTSVLLSQRRLFERRLLRSVFSTVILPTGHHCFFRRSFSASSDSDQCFVSYPAIASWMAHNFGVRLKRNRNHKQGLLLVCCTSWTQHHVKLSKYQQYQINLKWIKSTKTSNQDIKFLRCWIQADRKQLTAIMFPGLLPKTWIKFQDPWIQFMVLSSNRNKILTHRLRYEK